VIAVTPDSANINALGALWLDDFALIFVPYGHCDETKILPCAKPLFCLKGADGGHSRGFKLDSVWRGVKRAGEARVSPDDIDVVEIGLPALVTISALNQRTMDPFGGIVTNISADRLLDATTGQPYYLARIELRDGTSAFSDASTLKAGMNAEVMIVTGERTLLEYLTAPISRSLRRALTEQ
jgi:hypothetical protein